MKVRRVARIKLLRQFVIETLGRGSNRALRRSGYPLIAAVPSDAIGREIFAAGLYEEDLLLAVFDCVLAASKSAFARSIAVDVGANIGNHSLFLADRFARVIAFEPSPPLAKILDANLCLNDKHNVTLRQVGLSDQDAVMEYVPGALGNLGGGGFADKSRIAEGKPLPVRTGDAEINFLNFPEPIALIKIDVEGHEFAVLRGLERTIDRYHPFILFEANEPFVTGGAVDIFHWLTDHGYSHLYAIGPRWTLPTFFHRRLSKISGLIQLITALCRGSDYSLTEISEFENRPYPLLLASCRALGPSGIPNSSSEQAFDTPRISR